VNSVKVSINIFWGNYYAFDILNNMTKYETQNIEDFMDKKQIMKWVKEKKSFDIEIEEKFFVLRDFTKELKALETITIEF